MLVAIVAVGVVAILANRITTRQFEIYVSQGKQVRAEQLAPAFAAYYAQTGSWTGVEAWIGDLAELNLTGRGQGRGQGQGQGRGSAEERLLLADASGKIVADTEDSLVGEQLSESDITAGVPIMVEGQQVGTLFIPATSGVHGALEGEFLDQVNRTLLWAGLAAALVALPPPLLPWW
jgi:hypothetical protein